MNNALWLNEVGTRDPKTNTVRFSRTYTPSHATDIRITFEKFKAQKQLAALHTALRLDELMKSE